jgi:uncharacterized protein (TIGR03663 family)
MSSDLSRQVKRRPVPKPPATLEVVGPEPGVSALPRWELAAFACLVALAFVLRLVALPDKPYHHDESQDAYFSWLFFSRGFYRYNPVLHGPLRFYLNGLSYFLFGVSDLTARLAPAIAGTVIVALPFFIRRIIGPIAALGAAFLLCFSPAYLYFSRFAREDIYVACLAMGLLVATFRFLERPNRWLPSVILGLVAASLATKETTYITLFVAGTFFLAVLAYQWRPRNRRRGPRAIPLLAAVRSAGWDAWIWAAVTALAVYTLLFTTFFFHPEGLRDGLVTSLQYWLGQQPVQRGSQPWFYYLVLLVAYDWPELVLGTIGALVVLRRPSIFGVFLIWAFLLSLAVYTWAGEKMPWLLLHPLLPLLLLAGIGVQAIWRSRRTARWVGLAVAGLGGVFLLHSTSALSYDHPADPSEILVYTQTSPDVVQVRDQLMAIDRRVAVSSGHHLQLDVDAWGGTQFPWAWYLRRLSINAFPDMHSGTYRPTNQALLIADPNQARLQPLLQDHYRGYRFHLRAWWVQDYGKAGLADWARWVIWRTPWGSPGYLDEWIYVRADVPGASLIAG